MSLSSRRAILLASVTAMVAVAQRRRAIAESPPKGTLVLSGGGRPYDEDVLDAFWKLAGGDEAKVVVVPTAHLEMDAPETRPRRIELVSAPWKKRGAKQLQVCHTLSRDDADDEVFCQPLLDATAVWIGGGDQSRLLKTYRDTRFHRELAKVLERGGVVGGSSAGTAVLSEVAIVRERDGETITEPGFNLLPGTVVDQHFLARSREERLKRVVAASEKLMGLGIDEYTAAIIRGGELSVVGKSSVTVYAKGEGSGEVETRKLNSGDVLKLNGGLFP